MADETQGIQDWAGITELVAGRQTQLYQGTASSLRNVRRFKVPNAKVVEFCCRAVGWPFTEGSPAVLKRNLPQKDTSWVGSAIAAAPHTYCTAFSVSPFSGGGAEAEIDIFVGVPTAQWDYYLVDLTFESLKYDIRTLAEITTSGVVDQSRRFTYFEKKSGGTFLVPERGDWVFLGTGADLATSVPCGDKIGIWEAEGQWTLHWLDVLPAAWNETVANGLCGKCNIATSFGQAAETLLLLSVNKEVKKRVLDGALMEDVTFEFLFKATNVNKKRYSDSAGTYPYKYVVNKNLETQYLIEKADFNLLFRP